MIFYERCYCYRYEWVLLLQIRMGVTVTDTNDLLQHIFCSFGTATFVTVFLFEIFRIFIANIDEMFILVLRWVEGQACKVEGQACNTAIS